jgi:hypothetical protein
MLVRRSSILANQPHADNRLRPMRDQVGEYVEVDPPHRVAFTWGFEGTEPFIEPGATRVEVTLERDGEGTLLTLSHHGLAHGVRDAHAEGVVALTRAPCPRRRRPPQRARPLDRHQPRPPRRVDTRGRVPRLDRHLDQMDPGARRQQRDVVHFTHRGWPDQAADDEMAMCGYTWA